MQLWQVDDGALMAGDSHAGSSHAQRSNRRDASLNSLGIGRAKFYALFMPVG
jgi:hypothetical protein